MSLSSTMLTLASTEPSSAVELGLVGDVADGAADRPGPEQGALRAAQGFDAVEVEQIDVRREQRQRDHAFVEIDADLLLHARLVAGDLPGGDAADRDLALARAEILDGQAGDVAADVLERRGVGALDVLFGLRVDREGHVLDGRCALGRGDDDLALGRQRRGGRRARRRIDRLGGLLPARFARRPARRSRARRYRSAMLRGNAHDVPPVRLCVRSDIMPESAAVRKGRVRDLQLFLPQLLQDCYSRNDRQAKGSKSRGGTSANLRASRRRGSVADDLRLLLEAVALERLARLEHR